MLFWLAGFILSAANVIVGLLYPVWSTLETLENDEPIDDAQWLAYWLCYAVLLITEYTVQGMIQMLRGSLPGILDQLSEAIEAAIGFVIPVQALYYFIRLVALLWLTVPIFHGAEYMYENLLAPLYLESLRFLSYAPALEETIKQYEDFPQDEDADDNYFYQPQQPEPDNYYNFNRLPASNPDDFNSQLRRRLVVSS